MTTTTEAPKSKIFKFVAACKSGIKAAQDSYNADCYLFAKGTETVEVPGENLTWGQIALRSGYVKEGYKFQILIPSTGQYAQLSDTPEYGVEGRAVMNQDSKGLSQ